MAPRSKTDPAAALERARAALAETGAALERLAGERRTALLGEDDTVVERIDSEIEAQQRALRTRTDRVALLEVEARRQEAERQAQEKAALIGRIEAKFAERDRFGAELRKHLEAADKAFRRIVLLGREARSAWPWRAHDVPPSLLSPGAILKATEHELFRIGNRPLLYGGQAESAEGGLHFPGGRSPSLQLVGLPSKVQPIDVVLREGSALAMRIMKENYSTGIGEPASAAAPELLSKVEPAAIAVPAVPTTGSTAPEGAPVINGTGNGAAHDLRLSAADAAAGVPHERTPQEMQLAALLVEQNRLAEASIANPALETDYARICAQINCSEDRK